MNLVFPGMRPNHLTQHRQQRAGTVTAVLGPTNTGKTHYAIERMLGHSSGIIGLPLRLLAREVYLRVVEKAGVEAVALITGEERIKPKTARYWICTVEAMPRDLDVAFVAIDEIQLASDMDRGHVFTDRLLHRRGREETLIIGASTMTEVVRALLPGVNVLERPRLSTLSFAGEKKIARLPRRSAIVAFSAEEVYAIAEWIRRQRGGAAVVLGALSPRTRNAQVEMYQNGDVDYIVATDAIGMGLNLDVDHIAFAGDRKFDGWHYRRLHPAEFGQIAGRAGRYMRDGTFGTTGRCPVFDEDLVNALEEHRFAPIAMLQWRNTDLDFSSPATLMATLDRLPNEPGLTRSPIATDQLVLEAATRDADAMRQACTRADVGRLWDVCQIPDYRKLSAAAHSELALSVYRFVVRAGKIPDDWFASHVNMLDRSDGDIGTLSARIAHIRTWSYIANRPDWLKSPEYWQGVCRQVEDNLSDALHERLAQRFVDRRTSVLMRRLRENAMLEAEITTTGDVMVEGQHVGSLHGFRFTVDPQALGEEARALNAAALKALASEIDGRATRVHAAVDEAFVLAHDGAIRWLGESIAKISAGDHILKPRAQILADEHLAGPALEMVQKRVDLWLAQHVAKLLGPVAGLEDNATLEGIARGIGFQVAEALGVLERARVADAMKTLDQDGRSALRKLGVRFGAYHLYLPLQLKPAPRALAAQLWALKNGGAADVKGVDDVPHLAASGRTSFAADKDVAKGFYRAAGFKVCGERAVRVDILERLADLIRPAIAYRPGVTAGPAPTGAADGDGFVVSVAMTSLAGCSGENFAAILRSLGYHMESRKGPAITVPLLAAAPMQPLVAVVKVDGADVPEAAPALAEAAGETQADPAADVAADPRSLAPQDLVETVLAEDGVQAEPLLAITPDAAAEAIDGAQAASIDAPPLEIPLIEVWRPHRQSHANSRRPDKSAERGRGPRPQARTAVAAATGAEPAADGDASPAPDAQRRRPPSGRRYEGDKPRGDFSKRPVQPSAPQEVLANAAAPGDAAGGPDPKPAYEARPRFDNKRPDRPQRDRPQGARPQGDRPRAEGGRNPRSDAPRHEGARHGGPRSDEPRNAQRSFASTEKPPGRERQPDPDSPFAKLLALKAQLESKTRKE